MDTHQYAADLLARVRRMRLRDWDAAKSDLIDEIVNRDDMPALFQEFPNTRDVAECRIRVCLRRAYRKRFGRHANVAHAETTTHTNFGRF